MDTDGEVRPAKAEGSDIGAPTPRRATRSRLVLGGLAGLLIIAGAIYYLSAHRAGTEVVTGAGSEQIAGRDAAASNRPDGAETSGLPATSPQPPPSAQPPQPQPPQQRQSADATPPPATPQAEQQANAPAPPAPEVAANAQPGPNEASPDPPKVTPGNSPGATTQASPAAQPMRDQPAALPDQPAATPKTENTLVVMRGPANIRSAPGKKGRVIATAPKDATVKELERSGNWVQVETEAGTGWINAVLLGSPQAR